MLPAIKARDLQITLCSLKDIRAFVEKNHYSHNVNGVKIKWCFKVEFSEELVGAAIFGAMSTTAWKKFADSESKVLELRRLVLLDHAGRNSESRVIASCIHTIRSLDKQAEVIVSYADPHYGHSGTIYRASNFQYLGLSGADNGFLDLETGKVYHSRALRTKYKGDYKPFVKKLRSKLEAGLLTPLRLPPKHCYIYRINNRQPCG